MKIANINNLSLVAIAMERLMNRPDGLPGLGVLYGPSGYGKTTATVAVANSTQAYYVQLRSAWSKKTLLEKICFEMGIPAAKTTAANLDLICEQLAASQRPLILDEADYLVANRRTMPRCWRRRMRPTWPSARTCWRILWTLPTARCGA